MQPRKTELQEIGNVLGPMAQVWLRTPLNAQIWGSAGEKNGGRNSKKLLVGYNDLASVNPLLAKEWHPTKNGSLKPTDVMSCATKKVWWQCNKGHEWEATIAHRKYYPSCPQCKKENKQNRKK